VGLDTNKCFAKVDKNGDMEDSVGVKVEEVLYAIVPEQTFEEISGGECQSVLYEPGEHQDFVWVFSIGYGSLVVVRHRSISFSQRNPTRASRSSVFSFTFFHSLAGLGRGVEGGDDDWSASSASPRFLFFDVPDFELFIRDVVDG
jgi:hypothetical protein